MTGIEKVRKEQVLTDSKNDEKQNNNREDRRVRKKEILSMWVSYKSASWEKDVIDGGEVIS